MPLFLSMVYVLCHGLAIFLFPSLAKPLSYGFLTAAPLLAGLACVYRSRNSDFTSGWLALSLAMLLWAGGMASDMYQQVILLDPNATPGISMLLYVLYGVPLTFAVASPGREVTSARITDGVLAIVLGCLFFVHTFSFATISGADTEGTLRLRLMFDIENIFIAVFSLTRFVATDSGDRRSFFRTLTFFAFAYMAVAGFINHFEQDTDFGSLVDLLIELPFLLLLVLALAPQKSGSERRAPRTLANIVRAGSPLMMPATLLVVSGLIVRSHLRLAVGGFVVATLGYGLRSVLAQVRSFEESDKLSQLACIDPLTGVANRRQFDEALQREWDRARRHGEGLALLLIDIDHFKPLNDAFGHQMGDRYLCSVAGVLVGGVVRSSDVVARYGGDEFAVILPSTTLQGAHEVGIILRASVERLALPMPEADTCLTVCVGVGFVQGFAGHDPVNLIAVADAALYDAKHAGQNGVCQRVL